MHIEYSPRGVCSRHISIDVEDGVIQSVDVAGGCSGNLQGVARLLEGMDIPQAIHKLEGIRCGGKETSCPDQIARALKTTTGA